MSIARRECDDLLQAREEGRASLGSAGTEVDLTGIVAPPAIQLAGSRECASVGGPGCERDDLLEGRDQARPVGGLVAANSELSLAVVPPTLNPAVCLERAGEVVSRGDGARVFKATDASRRVVGGGARGGTDAECSVLVVSPAVQLIVSIERTAMVLAEGEVADSLDRR